MGGRRTLIYIIVVGLLLAAHYLYDNFAPDVALAAEPSEEVAPTQEPSTEAAPRKTTGAQWAELPAMKRQGDVARLYFEGE